MADSKDSPKQQQQDLKSPQQEQAESSPKPAKKRHREPIFEPEDLYKVKYDF